MKQPNPTSIVIEEQQKRELLAGYIVKFAAIANRAVTDELQEVFFEALHDLSEKELKRGLEEYLREGDRMPWPVDIRNLSEL